MTKKVTLGMIALLLVAAVGWVLWPSSDVDKESGQTSSSENSQGEKGDSTDNNKLASQHKKIELVSISGVVVDESGTAIPDAVVLVDTVSGIAIFKLDSALPNTTVADKQGRWTYSGLTPGKLRITASAHGYIPLSHVDVQVKPGKSKDEIRVVLRKGGHTLSGTISDIGGGPIASASVVATLSIGFTQNAYSLAISDDQGHYELQLEANEYSIVVTHPDYVEKAEPVKIASDRNFDLSLLPAAAVYGRVVNTEGEVVANARVYASGGQEKHQENGEIAGTTDTNEKGEFVLRRLPSGSYSLHAVAPGYSSANPVDIELGIAESLSGIDVIVDSAHSVSGRVVKREDKSEGVQGVQVMAADMRAQSFAAAILPTDEDGGFVIHGVLPGNYTLMAFHEERLGSFMEANVTMVDKDIDDVEIALKQGAVVRGRVEPAEVANISLEVEDPGFFNMKEVMMAQGAKAVSDIEGNFELKMVPQGDFLLRATAKDGRIGETKISITQMTQEGIVVSLVAGFSYGGRVVDQKGEAVIGVRVLLEKVLPERQTMRIGPKNSSRPGVTVNEKGEFLIRGLETGRYLVTVRYSRGRLSWTGNSDKSNMPLEMTITGKDKKNQVLKVQRARGVIEGKVMGVDGTPVVDAWVNTRRAHPERLAMIAERGPRRIDGIVEDPFRWGEKEEPVLTDADGRFRIPNLRDGHYQITARSSTGSEMAKMNNVQPGSDITLKLEALKSIRVRVTQGGQPVDQYTLRLSGAVDKVHEVRDGATEHVFSKLEAGKYSITALTTTNSASKDTVVGQEPEIIVTLDLKSFCGIKGKVVALFTKQPIASLMIMPMGGGVANEMEQGMNMFSGNNPTTDANGHFSLPALLCKSGTVLFLDSNSMTMGGPGASKNYEVEEGVKDLGTIYMLSKAEVPETERGSFGLTVDYGDGTTATRVSTLAKGGAAETAGISVDNSVRSIEQVELADLGEDLVYSIFYGNTTRIGDVLSIEIEDSSGQTKELKLTAIAASTP